MILPELQEIPKSQYMTYRFAGLNRTPDNVESEFRDMKNMSVDKYPSLTNRKARGLLPLGDIDYSEFDLFFGDDIAKAVYREDDKILCRGRWGYVNENATEDMDCVQLATHTVAYDRTTGFMTENDGTAPYAKDISYSFTNNSGLSMYVVPFLKSGNEIYTPVNVDSRNSGTDKLLEATFDSSGVMTNIASIGGGSEEHKALNITKDGLLKNIWVDTESVSHEEGVATSYCGIKIGKIVNGAWEDVLDLSEEFVKNEVITISSGSSLTDKISGTYTVQGFKDDWLIVTRFGRCIKDTSAFTIERVIPTFEKIISSENRLWGCTKDGREIYASQQGQPGHWQVFAGEASDSIALTVGTGGMFTGACALGGMPVFFKENYIHTVTGATAQTATVRTVETNGVKSGCMRSVKVINDVAYFVGKDGVYCSNGGRSQLLSKQLGELKVKSAVGGVLGAKYYVSIEEENEVHTLYVYDTQTGLWHKEDNLPTKAMMSYKDDLFMLTSQGMFSVNKGTFDSFAPAEEEAPVEWEVESEEVDYATIHAKYVSRMVIKMVLDRGSRASVSMAYDGTDNWEPCGSVIGVDNLQPQTVWIIPKRCHTYRWKINGVGDVNIVSVTKFLYEGSEVWL